MSSDARVGDAAESDQTSALKVSPLHAWHERAGAKFAPFAGWSMPLEYSGVRSEHTAVRTTVGLFDVSHLGTVQVQGPHVAELLNRVFSNDLAKIGPGRAQYTLLSDDSGRVLDDVIVYLLSDDEAVVVPNAANAGLVVAAIRAVASPNVTVDDRHSQTAIIAVQGPRASELLRDLGVQTDLRYMQVVATEIVGAPVVLCRTGYTGERGYELLVPSDQALSVWESLLEAGERFGVVPCGLGARDTLRTEMGYPLHGNDLGGDIGPLEAGLSWAVGWDKPTFNGREALVERRARPLSARLQGIALVDRGVLRAGMQVHLHPDGPVVGKLTSGTFSPTLHRGIGLALLDPTIGPGDEVVVNVRGRWLTARVVELPMVPAHVRD